MKAEEMPSGYGSQTIRNTIIYGLVKQSVKQNANTNSQSKEPHGAQKHDHPKHRQACLE